MKRLALTQIFSMSFFRTYTIWLLLPFLGGLFGILASSANPLAIGMGAASLIGISLLRKATWNIELVITLGLFGNGLLMLIFGDAMQRMSWGVALLGFMALVSAFYKALTDPNAIKSTPVFIWLALLFFLYALIVSVCQIYTAKETIVGFKAYFQMWGLMFSLCWSGFSKKNIDHWCLVILIICLLQTPICVYQLIVLVPIRESYVEMYPGLVPIDVVAGTFFGGVLAGSNNAEMATTLLMLFAFLQSRYKAKLLAGKQFLWISLILLLPLVIGETKILVIFFPLVFLVLYRGEIIARPAYGVIALLFGSMFTALMINAYMIVTKLSLDALIFDTMKYNVYEIGYGGNYLNRTTALTFWWNHNSMSDPLSLLFGHGLGSAKPGDGTTLGGHMDTLYPNYGIGLTGAALMLWEIGLFGLCFYVLIMVAAWQCANRIIKVAVDATMRADAAAIQSAIALFAIFPFYRDTLLNDVSFQSVFTFILGYLAWMSKQYTRHKS